MRKFAFAIIFLATILTQARASLMTGKTNEPVVYTAIGTAVVCAKIDETINAARADALANAVAICRKQNFSSILPVGDFEVLSSEERGCWIGSEAQVQIRFMCTNDGDDDCDPKCEPGYYCSFNWMGGRYCKKNI